MMKTNTNSHIYQLWQSAVPLKDARILFAPEDLAERFKKTSDVTLLGELAKQGASLAGKQLAGLEALAKTMEAAQPAYAEKWETIHALNEFFLDMFRSGDLRCLAFEAPRTLGSLPVEIEPEIWSVAPDWDMGEYKINGLHFIEARVLPKSSIAQPTYEPELAVKGRPTIARYVEAAFDGLKTAGKIDTENSAKSHYPMVRRWISNNFEYVSMDAEKFSDEGIRRHFSPLFKELAKTTKQ